MGFCSPSVISCDKLMEFRADLLILLPANEKSELKSSRLESEIKSDFTRLIIFLFIKD